MKFLKIFALILMIAGVIASAHAIEMNADIYPSNNIVKTNENFLVFGYAYSDYEIDTSVLKIKVYNDDGYLVDTYTPHITALNGDNTGKQVYFYSTIDLSDEGDYDVVLKAEGSTLATQGISVRDMDSRDVKITSFDYDISGDRITFDVEVENMDTSDHSITIYLQGESNFRNPKTFTMDLNSGEKDSVKKTYYVSDFGSHDFIIACQAKADSGAKEAYSAPDYVLISNEDYTYDYDYNYYNDYYTYDNYQYNYAYPSYGYGNVIISDIELNENTFYPGDIVEGTVSIKNTGSSESQYKFEYTYNNQVYKMGDVGYVLPGETATQSIVVEIPEADSFKLSAKTTSGATDIEERTYMISHKLKYFTPSLSSDSIYVNAGDNATINLTIANRGNEDDSYKIKVTGWDSYMIGQDSLALKSATQKSIPVTIHVPDTAKVDAYTILIDIENSDGAHKTKTLEISVLKSEAKQSDVVFNDSVENKYFEANETIVYTMKVTNNELDEKEYFVDASADGVNFAITPESFTLGSQDSKEISIAATPSEAKDYKTDLSVYANGEKIFEKENTLQYTENKQRAISSLTGYVIFQGQAWMPAVYMLAVIGIVTIGYISYRVINERAKPEPVVRYGSKPVAPAKPQTQNTQALPLQPKTDYPEDSFMRRF